MFDCSNLHLSVIPKNVPKHILRLNLSRNELESLADDAFDECCGDLKVLDLSHNHLSTLTKKHFEKLKNLETLYLGANKLTSLAPDTFEALISLQRLDLRRNPIKFDDPSPEGLFIQSSVVELNLDYCGIKDFPEDAFKNMRQLRNLTLAGNPIDESLDTSAFEPLENLLKLRIPNLTEATIYLICEKLISIDVINFDEFNVSCTVLSDDNPFMESILSNDPVEEPRIDSVIAPTTRKTTVTPSTTTSTEAPEENKQIPSVQNANANISEPALGESSDEMNSNSTLVASGPVTVEVDSETIKFILVCELTVSQLLTSDEFRKSKCFFNDTLLLSQQSS